MKVLLFGVALLFSLYAPQRVSSRPGGAPASACDNLTPGAGPHGAPQDVAVNAFPYRLNLSPLCYNGTLTYTPGATYTVTLMGSNGETFQGFLIQTRVVADDNTRVGTFAVTSGSTDTQLSLCPIPADGVTHTSASDKTYINFNWTAPAAGTGQVRFGMAVVQTQPTHWADQRSMVIGEGGVNATGGGAACTVTTMAPDNGATTMTGSTLDITTAAAASRLPCVGFWSLMMVALAVAIKTVL